ncbi:MAG: M23 family metallopeptidase [Clostridia bacterium]
MDKKSVFSTLRFILITIFLLGLVFTAVMVTVLNTYRPAVKVSINDKFLGYYSSEGQFDEIYSDLVTEKQNIDPNAKVYFDSEPTFETSYIRGDLLSKQNVYSNVREQVRTEYNVYKIFIDSEEKMIFGNLDDTNKYAADLKREVPKVKTEVKSEKVLENVELTTTQKADSILKELIEKNKPVEIANDTKSKKRALDTQKHASADVANIAAMQDGIWPTTARYVSSSYGWRWGSLHSGTDIAGKFGDPIYAYKSGVVTFSGWQTSYGNIIKVDHGNGFSTWYAHCSQLIASAGAEVSQGDVIAKMGSTGFSTGNHVHFEVRINGVHVNSYPYIAGK